MKDHLSAAEIASLALPGLPATKRGVQLMALRDNWSGRDRAGRGGGVEYAIDNLPAQSRLAYVARHAGDIAVPASIAREAAAEPAAQSLSGRGSEARDARLALLALADRYAGSANLLRKRADAHFCAAYNAAQIEVAPWIRAAVRQLSPRTLHRWRAFARQGQRSRLAVDHGARRKNTSVLDRANEGEVKAHVLALLAKQPQLTAHHIRALILDATDGIVCIDDRRVPLPPVRTFQRALKQWRNEYRVALESIRNPDRFKGSMRFAARVSAPAPHVNALWQIDASPADVLTHDGRHSIYVCEDIYSRRLIALVSRTARASAVGLLIRKAILAWGVPETIKTDNGSDFVARDTARLFAALAIEHVTAAPFRPEQKGHVERAIGTLQRGLMRTLPGFIGHSVADRKAIEARKSFAARLGEAPEDTLQVSLTAPELQHHIDQWCDTVYGHAPHAGLRGQTPFATAATCPQPIRRIGDVRALDMLLAPVAGKDGLRTVTKTGLRIDGAHYIAGFLDVGATVLCRMDAHDMGRVYVFDASGATFLGEAIAPEVLGIDPAAAIAAVRAEQKRIIDEQLAAVRAKASKIKAADMAPAIHRQAAIAAGKVTEFPKRSSVHVTPALDAADAAVRGADCEPVHSAEVLALQARLLAEQSGDAAPVIALRDEETPHHRWRRAREIEAAIARNATVADDDLLWLGGYREGPEYRGFLLTYGDLSRDDARASG